MKVGKRPFNKLIPVPYYRVEINDNFWSIRQQVNREVSIYSQLQKFEEDHHIDNFRVAAGLKKGVQKGEFYFDSDLYKWIEAASYTLKLTKDLDLTEKVKEIVDLIVKSQLKDGYINTFFSTKFPQKRFVNLYLFHEDYCAGHLIQAAMAYYEATGTDNLLKAALKFADLLVKIFLGGKRKGAPGHEEIEMALIELYRSTKNDNYLFLAQDFLERRGKIKKLKTYVLNQFIDLGLTFRLANKINKRFDKEKNISELIKEEKGETVEFLSDLTISDWLKFIKSNLKGEFNQINRPIREMRQPVGHAVRAMYLYCGMADLYSEIGDKDLLKAMELIWIKMVKARMYITGGIGSVRGVEGFSRDFDLRNEDSYSETCAAIGNIMWNWRMLNITGKCKYADLTERLLYNAMLVGQSIDGKKYTYINSLISNGNDKRHEWFLCACCPPNIARNITSIGQYVYSESNKEIWVHQYIGNKSKFLLNNNKEVQFTLKSGFPWNGNVKIELELSGNQNFSIFLRIPLWSKESELSINDSQYQNTLTPGRYVEIIRNWNNKDVIKLNFNMEPKFEFSDRRINSNRNKIAISYGPLIYCLEEIDNKNIKFFDALISKKPNFTVRYGPDLLGGINVIEGNLLDKNKFVAIPYYAWCNRGSNKMQVWLAVEK